MKQKIPFSVPLLTTALAVASQISFGGCADKRTTEACLILGDPECGANSASGSDAGTNTNGAGGNANTNSVGCATDPNIGQSCVTSNNTEGKWNCTTSGMRCQNGNTTNPDGGNTTYNCASEPENGKRCATASGPNTGTWGCNASGTGLACFPDNPTSNPDGGAGGGNNDGGIPPPYNCKKDPALYSPCLTPAAHIGVKVCNQAGNGLVCQCTNDCVGAGGGGAGGNAGTGGGQPVYNCALDPKFGASCTNGIGACSRAGTSICNQAGDGLVCNAVPGAPSTESCGNAIDDNCNGVIDESPCTSPNGGGGSGGSGSGGGASCTPVVAAAIMLTGNASLTTLLKGIVNADTSNPKLLGGFDNLQLLTVAADSGLSISTSTVGAQLNYWEPNSPSGVPMPLIDNLFCRQLGINPPTPSSCNADIIGDRKSAPYMSALRIDWECARTAACPATIAGFVPADLFTLKTVVDNDTPLTGYSFASTQFGILEMPPLCVQ